MANVHQMHGSLSEGEAFEIVLDGVHFDRYESVLVPRSEQRRGRDRILKCRTTGLQFPVEYKADKRAAETLALFFEITSVDYSNKTTWAYDDCDKKGWAFTCTARTLTILIPPCGLLLSYLPRNLRRLVEGWMLEYPIRLAINDGYKTWGVCVPIEVAAAAAISKQRLRAEDISLREVLTIVERLQAGRRRVA